MSQLVFLLEVGFSHVGFSLSMSTCGSGFFDDCIHSESKTRLLSV